ncbi:MAG: hypothetical protein KBA66_01170 [Leptospiraceae bacterium]|nr:hypothetical protein [Leptospiraceae bacterium]
MKSILFLLLFLFYCNEKPIPAWQAQSQINAAAEFKARECNQSGPPQPPLLVFTDQDSRNLNLCSIAITRTDCPFEGYPIICLSLYMKDKVDDIPWYLNFNNDLAKRQLK